MTEADISAARAFADQLSLLNLPDLTDEARAAVHAALQERLKDRVARGFIADQQQAAELLTLEFEAMPQELASLLYRTVVEDHRQSHPETREKLARTHLAVLPPRSWSAMTVPMASANLIAIDMAVADALYLLAKLMVVNLLVGEPEQEEPPHEIVPVPTLIRLAKVYFGAARMGGRFLLAASVNSSPSQAHLAARITHYAERLLVHHEFAHIDLDHLSPPGSVAEAAHTDTLSMSERQEVEADTAAASTMFAPYYGRTLDATDQFELLAMACGVRLLFETLDLVERSFYVVRPSSHPPSQARYLVLRDVLIAKVVPPQLLEAADGVTSSLVEIADACRSTEPQPRYVGSMREELAKYRSFATLDDPKRDGPRWAAVDHAEELLRRLDLHTEYHLTNLARVCGASIFAEQHLIVQMTVSRHEELRLRELLEDPKFAARLRRFGNHPDTNPGFWRDAVAANYDAIQGALMVDETLGPVVHRLRAAAAKNRRVTFELLVAWVRDCVPEDALLSGIVLSQRILLDPRENFGLRWAAVLSGQPFLLDERFGLPRRRRIRDVLASWRVRRS
ncbi:hypothetical protein [Phytohabitans houttuyneae]|uniref:Uncharacterized protein n=1 Tax=Phytohabitans houttuyneae TaxID=1076126 RepID=A0A6V8KSN7_9ACTN|nr:hypothetical protein [Phytohabitans houttuyneae]GFJ84846.1 hypothetical protein Phou_090260 [Phytohabitans houttuyneae]